MLGPVNDVAQIAALVAAVTYIGAAPMELFFFNKPWAQSFLHVEADNIADALGFWRPRGASVLGTIASSLPPLVALVAATM